jgi:hypothetical protein
MMLLRFIFDRRSLCSKVGYAPPDLALRIRSHRRVTVIGRDIPAQPHAFSAAGPSNPDRFVSDRLAEGHPNTRCSADVAWIAGRSTG